MIDNLSIAANAFLRGMLILLSVDEILLPKYADLSFSQVEYLQVIVKHLAVFFSHQF